MDALVTGLPRSGASLAATLVDLLPNSICLNEPPGQMELVPQAVDAVSFGKLLIGDFAWTRAELQRGAKINASRASAFDIPALQPDFILAAKHSSFYTVMLPTLAKFNHFKIIAVIRNPLDLFEQWQQMPQTILSRGNPAGVARFWMEALDTATQNSDNATIFAKLYDMYLERYHLLREQIHIVKYEEISEDPAIISRIFGLKIKPAGHNVQPRASRQLLNADTEKFRAAIKKYGVFTKMYYKGLDL